MTRNRPGASTPWRGALVVGVLLVAAIGAGCSGSGGGPGPADGTSRGNGLSGGATGGSTIEVDGAQRTYRLVRPPGVSGPAPTVIALHGAPSPDFGRSIQVPLAFDDIAAAQGIVTVYPDGDPDLHGWHGGCCYGAAADQVDVHFISTLITHLVDTGVTDPDHVVILGHSAGALFANNLGCEIADQISAVVSVSGGQLRPPASVTQVVTPPISPCAPSRPITHLEIHGLDDGAIPANGINRCAASPCGPGQQGYLAPVEDTDSWWRTLDSCPAPASGTASYGGTTATTSLAHCSDGTVVGYALLPGVGHPLDEIAAHFDVRQTLVELALGRPLTTWGVS